MAGKVIHFEIPIDDSDRATSFYREAFGWSLERWGPVEYWTTEAGEGEGIGGALLKRSDDLPSLMFYIAVDNIDAALDAVEAAGGARLTERMAIPAVGWSAFFEDTSRPGSTPRTRRGGGLPARATGTLAAFAPAVEPAVRRNSGVEARLVVGVAFDPMLPEVVAHTPPGRRPAPIPGPGRR